MFLHLSTKKEKKMDCSIITVICSQVYISRYNHPYELLKDFIKIKAYHKFVGEKLCYSLYSYMYDEWLEKNEKIVNNVEEEILFLLDEGKSIKNYWNEVYLYNLEGEIFTLTEKDVKVFCRHNYKGMSQFDISEVCCFDVVECDVAECDNVCKN
jgi:hypothetical protein